MMDYAADDLMTASIGRSPRNDPAGGSDPPGSNSGAQADLDGLPLVHATKPASTEAQLRQDHLMIRTGQVTRGDQGSVDGGERTFPSTLSMLQLASRHRICNVNTFYRKHFVSFALPEELADGCRKALAAARSSSSLGGPPPPKTQRRPCAVCSD